MDLEKGRELEGLTVLHEGLDGENSGEVTNESGDNDLVGGKGGDTLDIGVEVDGETVRDGGEEDICEGHDRENDRNCDASVSIFEQLFGGVNHVTISDLSSVSCVILVAWLLLTLPFPQALVHTT